MDIKTILWPTDLSPNSLKIAGHVKNLALKHDARVVLLFVGVDLCSYFPAYGNYPSADHLRDFQNWELEQARTRLNKVCEEKLGGCPMVEVKLLLGSDPAVEILKAIDDLKADLVVMTSRGHGFAELGGITKKVIKDAPVPVQVMNPEKIA